MKPKVFIGCTLESIIFAEAIHRGLDSVSIPTIWNQGQSIFELTSSTLESLEKAKEEFDFAILILTPDDSTESRGDKTRSPRDNVIFELGIFMGSIGRERTFIVCDSKTHVKVPSDLKGITFASIDSTQKQSSQAVASAVYQVKESINRLGFRKQSKVSQIALIGSTTDAVVQDKRKERGLQTFYATLFEELERSHFGVSTCGPEIIQKVLFDLFRKKLDTYSKSQIEEFEQKIRWYWRSGSTVGMNREPPVFRGIKAKDQQERRHLEIDDASIILAVGGRSGTRDHLENLFERHKNTSDIFDFDKKPILLIGWFGGATMDFMKSHQESLQKFTETYSGLAPYDEISDWHVGNTPNDLAKKILIPIRKLFEKVPKK